MAVETPAPPSVDRVADSSAPALDESDEVALSPPSSDGGAVDSAKETTRTHRRSRDMGAEAISLFARAKAGLGFASSETKDRSSSDAKDAKDAKESKVGKVGKILAKLGGGGRDLRGHTLQPSSSSDMCGWLHKQGHKVGAWQRRYFVLHGAILSYYDEEAAALEADERRCRGVGYIGSANMWPETALQKPAQVPDSRHAWHAHAVHACVCRLANPRMPCMCGAGARLDLQSHVWA